MFGRGIATVAIWLSPAAFMYHSKGWEAPGIIAYGVFMILGTIIVWAGTIK